MKGSKQILSLLLLLCCLLCSCSQHLDTEPPADSLMTSTSPVVLENGQIIYKAITTVRYGKETEYFELQLEDGVETYGKFQPDYSINYGELPYGHYTAALDAVITQLKKDHMGLTTGESETFGILYNPGRKGQNQQIATQMPEPAGTSFRYIGYYVYSISQKTLILGDGAVMGNDDWGTLSVTNYHPFDASLPLSPQEREHCYILIAD